MAKSQPRKGQRAQLLLAALKSRGDSCVGRLLRRKNLILPEISHRLPESEDGELLKAILAKRGKGYSVRRAIINLQTEDGGSCYALVYEY